MRSVGGPPRPGQHCTAALRCPRLWFIAGGRAVLERRLRNESVRAFSMSKKQYRIAVIPGDGIGKEVMPEGLRVLEIAAKKHGVSVQFDHFDFSSWEYYEKHGQMM